MNYFHFTSSYHYELIKRDGYLRKTESNVHPTIPHYGPDVVWITNVKNPLAHEWAQGSIVDKLEVRIELDLEEGEAEKWTDFASRHDVPKWWLDGLAKVGGDDSSWYVVENKISVERFKNVAFLSLTSTAN